MNKVEVFEAARPQLYGLAYRMLATRADAEDVVQETWLRWQRTDASGVQRPDAWLTTTTARLAIDRLRQVRRRREEHLGPWLPEPILTDPGPEDVVDLAESLTLGFLVLLDRLEPVERAVILLVDVFGVRFVDVARAVGKSEVACRQLASRARRRLRHSDHRVITEADRRVVADLLVALASGDADAVLRRLAPGVRCVTDLGSRRGGRHPVEGPARVARFLLNLAARHARRTAVTPTLVNGDLGIVVWLDGLVDSVMAFEVHDQLVTAIWVVRDPGKLERLNDSVKLR